MVSAGGASGRWWGHEGGALMNGISALVKGPQRALPPLLHLGTQQEGTLCEPGTKPSSGTLIFNFSASRQWDTTYKPLSLWDSFIATQWYQGGSPGGSVLKNLTVNAGDPGLIPGPWTSSREGNGSSLQYSCPESPMDRGAWWGYSRRGCKESDTPEQLNNNHKSDWDIPGPQKATLSGDQVFTGVTTLKLAHEGGPWSNVTGIRKFGHTQGERCEEMEENATWRLMLALDSVAQGMSYVL